MQQKLTFFFELLTKALLVLFLSAVLLVISIIIIFQIFYYSGFGYDVIDASKHFREHKKIYTDIANFYKNGGDDKQRKKIENMKKAFFTSVNVDGTSEYNTCIEFILSPKYNDVVIYCAYPNAIEKYRTINQYHDYSSVSSLALEQNWFIAYPDLL